MPANWQFTTVDNPGSPSNPNSYLRSVNDDGTLIGGNGIGRPHSSQHAFVGTPGAFEYLQPPGSAQTVPGRFPMMAL